MTTPTPTRSAASPVVVEPLLSVRDVADALGCGRRTIERMRSAGKFPRPDLHVGKLPRWKRETLTRWIAEGGAA